MAWDEARLQATEKSALACDSDDACTADVVLLIGEVRRLTGQRDRLIRAVYMLGGLEHFAQCPCCEADRTLGEWHAEGCEATQGVER